MKSADPNPINVPSFDSPNLKTVIEELRGADFEIGARLLSAAQREIPEGLILCRKYILNPRSFGNLNARLGDAEF